MASGITTNTTQADINVKVVIPEITSGVVIPGVAPNADLTLATQDNITGITSNVITPELATSTNTNPELTTSENTVATEVTLAKFVRGLEALNLKNPIYKLIGKALEDTNTIADIFSRRVSYIRGITDQFTSTQNIYFSAGKGIRNTTILGDLLSKYVIYGRQFTDITSFVDGKINYRLNTKYTDVAVFRELITTAANFSRNITGKEITNISDTQLNKRIGIPVVNNIVISEALAKNFNVSLIQPTYVPDVYYSTVLKLFVDSISNSTQIVITPRKAVNERLALQESKQRLWNSFRNFSETKTIGEVRQIRTSTRKLDIARAIESFGKKQNIETYEFNRALDNFSRQANYRRRFTDLLNTTDDYYGLANIDDDQYAGFYKQVRESVVFQERFKRAVATILINRLNISDPFFRVVSYERSFTGTGTAEKTNNYETISKNSRTFKSSVVSKQDYYSRVASFYRLPNDLFGLHEQKQFYVRNYITPNTASITDTKALLLRSYLNTETVTLATGDTRYTITGFNRTIADVLNVTDDYYGLATLDDDQYAGFYKQVRDGLTLQNPNPVKAVSAILTPSIADISDPYVSIAVFNRAFTETINRSESVNKTARLFKLSPIIGQDYFNKITNFYREITEPQSTVEEILRYVSKYAAPNSITIADRKQLSLYRLLGNTEIITSTDSKQTVTNFIRRPLDSINVTDDYYGLSNIEDDQYARVNKGVIDIISFAERVTPVSFTFYTPLTQSYTANDQLTKFVRKYPSDNILLAIEQKAVRISKYAANEIFYNYDQSSRTPRKAFQDTINFTDLAVVTRLLRQRFLETLQAGSNDVRLLKPKKVVRDTITLADLYSYRMGYGKSFIDILAINSSSDRKYFRVGKGIRDTVNFTDSAIASKRFIQQFLETLRPNANDIKLKPKKVIRDTATSADLYNYRMNYARSLIEILTINSSSDRKYFRVGKGIRDTAQFTDTLQKVIAKYYFLYDTVRLTDDYYGLANVDDDQYARVNKRYNDVFIARDYFKYRASIKLTDTFTKTDRTALKVTLPRIDSISFTEAFVYSKFSGYTRTFVDQILKSDSGTINNQNYFADKYVAPGYAGTNRTIIGS